MIPLSETLKKKEYKRKKRKPRKKLDVEKTVAHSAGNTLQYGKGSHVVLCYASMRSRMRDREWFTSNDYVKFQEDRFTLKEVSAMCARLHKNGYIVRQPLIRPKTSQKQPPCTAYQYRITDLGLLALNRLAQKHKRNLQEDE